MKNDQGFVFPLADRIITALRYCNLVEGFKFLAILSVGYMAQGVDEATRLRAVKAACNIAIDVYQITKYSVIGVLWIWGGNNQLAEYVAYYLMVANLFTYFYYHTWGAGYEQSFNREASNRRLVNLILAIIFHLLCYGYLYGVQYATLVTWPGHIANFQDALYFSVATAFALPIDRFGIDVQFIRMVMMWEHLSTFLFIAIVLVNTIPEQKRSQEKP